LDEIDVEERFFNLLNENPEILVRPQSLKRTKSTGTSKIDWLMEYEMCSMLNNQNVKLGHRKEGKKFGCMRRGYHHIHSNWKQTLL
jgi:hypothetical protein